MFLQKNPSLVLTIFLPNFFFSLVHKILVTSPNLGKSAKVIKGFQDKIEVIPLGIKIINGHQKND